MRKYLDDIGVTDRPDTWLPNDDRQRLWEDERRVYGFDSRETWGLDFTFYLWLYEHLMMYKEKAANVVDLEYDVVDYEGKTYNQLQLIDMMLKRLRFRLSEEFDDSNWWHHHYVHEIEKIWALVLPAMWW